MENNKKNKKLLYLAVSDENNYDMDQNIYDSLTLIFPNIIRYYYRKRFKESGICKVQNEIIDIVMKEKPDFVFWPTSMYEIQEDTLLQIHKNGATIIAWFSDDHCRFDSYSKYLMPFIDYSITTDPVSYKKYKALGAGCILSQWAANHRSYKKIDCKKQYEVSFIGRNISSRSRFIQKLENSGVHVDTFGDGFGGIINFEKMISIINSSKINLNFSGSYVTTEIKQIKGRIFEIPMCGSFCLTEYVTGLENFFEIDKEIVCFNTIDEAAHKIKYYLEHDNERETIARASWMRAKSHHTWNKRMDEIFQIIFSGVSIKCNPPIPDVNKKLPSKITKIRSQYHYNVAKEWFAKNNIGLFKDEINISLRNNPQNFYANYLNFIGKLPDKLKINAFTLLNLILKYVYFLRKKLNL